MIIGWFFLSCFVGCPSKFSFTPKSADHGVRFGKTDTKPVSNYSKGGAFFKCIRTKTNLGSSGVMAVFRDGTLRNKNR